MMGQRKLTEGELQTVMNARQLLRQVLSIADHERSFGRAMSDLSDIAANATSDGKPYVEPQPEIGEGYRLATEADKDRRDLEFWSQIGGGWLARQTMYGTPLDPDYHYRVPVDRVPTDEDARQRPTVMVRDDPMQPWYKTVLIAVANGDGGSFWEKSFHTVTCWQTCRFPYPGELD
jgi:hypothetical protein